MSVAQRLPGNHEATLTPPLGSAAPVETHGILPRSVRAAPPRNELTLLSRRLLLAICLAAGVACLPGVASAARAPSAPVTLTASAEFPGVAEVQRYVVHLDRDVRMGARRVAQPDPATVVLEDRPVRTVRRNGKPVEVPVAPCVRATVGIGLVVGVVDVLALARWLLPQAQRETWHSSDLDGDQDAVTVPPAAAVRTYVDVRGAGADPSPRRTDQIEVTVAPWKPESVGGTLVNRVHLERLRRGDCRGSTAVDVEQARDPMDRMANLLTYVGYSR